MPGALVQWPSWPEFTAEKGEKNSDLIQYKKAILEEYGAEALRTSWLKVCAELEKVTDEIADKGTSIIPDIDYEELFKLNETQKQNIKNVGCFVVRQVVGEGTASQWFNELKEYQKNNKSRISGWPAETPFVLRIYWSPTQVAARSHPNQLRLQRELNSWWKDTSEDAATTTSPEPLSYADAVRIRPPGIPFYGLGPHIDAGSLCRWVDPTYQKVYDAIFRGKPETHDTFDLSIRKYANQAYFDGGAHSTVFRAFQGWTALTKAGPKEGSLLLYPNVRTAIAYVLLRPFFAPPEKDEDIMDASKWTLDVESSWFPGTWRDDSQLASHSSHPHLRLRDCMVNIPVMNAGDTIWWHCDMLHAVEVDHIGDHDSSVAYVAATPTTPENLRYIKEQNKEFVLGRPPFDFRKATNDESKFVGWTGETGILSGDQGRRAMGFVI